jgi:hypothetical protein
MLSANATAQILDLRRAAGAGRLSPRFLVLLLVLPRSAAWMLENVPGGANDLVPARIRLRREFSVRRPTATAFGDALCLLDLVQR